MSKPMIFLCCLLLSYVFFSETDPDQAPGSGKARPRCLRTYTIRAVPANTNDSVGWPWGLSRRVTGREGHGASTPWSPYYDNYILIYSYFIFHILGIIIPIHSYFSEGLKPQPVYIYICLYHFLWFLMIKESRGFQVNPSFDCQLWEDFPLFS